MDWIELNNAFTALDENMKTSYEQTRLLMHSIYQVNINKKVKPTDIIQFSWDVEKETMNTDNLISLDEATKLINNIKNGKETV